VLLHCCSSYPAPLDQINLRAMSAMGAAFGRMVGFSDHTIGARAPLAAAAMGAVAIEKHFTNDPARPGPDHRFSATPDILAEIATGVAEIHALRGDGLKRTTAAERVSKASGRRSAFALRDLPAGHVLADGDYRFVRPGAGWPADRPERLVQARLARAVAEGHPITGDDLAAE
jgi:N-acetylneuraminate synthase